MARQIETKSAVGHGQSAVRMQACRELALRILSVFAIAAILAAFSNLRAESVTSKNKEGNQLYTQGKYEDAEKAYLEAQAQEPGKPEVIYNLGNSLIRQKKYDQGIQTLRQSISKGSPELKENSWYNTGNALFSKGEYRDSAEAFIQALRLDPGDKDAKHNLELALLKLKQQEQKQSSESQKQDQPQDGSEDKKQPPEKGPKDSENQKDGNEPANPQTAQSVQREGAISKEQAVRILEAVQSREIEEQRKLLERRARERTNSKDW